MVMQSIGTMARCFGISFGKAWLQDLRRIHDGQLYSFRGAVSVCNCQPRISTWPRREYRGPVGKTRPRRFVVPSSTRGSKVQEMCEASIVTHWIFFFGSSCALWNYKSPILVFLALHAPVSMSGRSSHNMTLYIRLRYIRIPSMKTYLTVACVVRVALL
ncbi:hypothetical protein BR93DRAFT_419966 [Coniochaeta sp. PMI_546]|nr:hypothetical protein BR93DRAFT_419966 [Coniochaeta sp. PMI_546]